MNKYEIEYSVIKSIIYLYENKEESRGIEILSNIKNEYFTNDSCKRIISLMKNFMGQNKTFDRIIINSNLEADLRNTFNEIVATSISYLSINEYVNLLIDNYKETQIIEITSKAKNRLDKSRLEDPIDKIIHDIMQALYALSSNEVSNLNDMKKIGDELLENLFNNINTNELEQTNKKQTGLQKLDDLLGPLKRKQLIIIGGHSGMGKTSLALQIALNLARNGNIVYIASIEMSEQEIYIRLISQLKVHDFSRIQNMKFSQDDNDIKLFRDGKIELDKLNNNIVIDDKSNTILEIENKIKKIKPDFLIVDYLQIVEPENPKEIREQQVSQIARRLKNIAKKYNLSVILLSQLNDNNSGQRPSEANIRESKAPYFHSDNVIFIHKLSEDDIKYYLKASKVPHKKIDSFVNSSRNHDADFFEIILRKNRNGKEGSFIALFRKNFHLFYDLELNSITMTDPHPQILECIS